jgi:hypothetical protein
MQTAKCIDDYVKFLEELVRDLRFENAALVERLLNCSNITSSITEQQVEIPQMQQAIGREPWYRRKARLEAASKKPKLSEITGIRDPALVIGQIGSEGEDNASQIG